MTPRRKSPVVVKVTESHMCSVGLRLEILSRVPFFAGLPHGDLEAINRLFREQGFGLGEIICFAGDPAERLFVLADGRAKLLSHSLSGKDVLLDILKPGEFFGSLSSLGDDVYPETAEAQTQTCVLSIGAEDFRQMLQAHPQVALKVLDIVSGRLRGAHDRLMHLSALPVEARLANILLILSGKFGKRTEVGLLIEVPLTREDLAAMTGTTTESASRVLSQFQRDRLIRSGRQWVAVRDSERLKAIAEQENS
ncbi:MAG: Crp/Fnr family transcriptional regulator [Bacteroidota bacterium]